MAWASVGVDLAGSPKRITGLCRMRLDLYCETRIGRGDDEIINFVLDSMPKVVAVDAPLGIAEEGRILRGCEERLMDMGIRIFPTTLRGMRMLAERSISLKRRLEERGFEVIEVYPRATKEILGISTDRKDLETLRDGLIGLGVRGLRSDETIHELDAVACALTGIAYIIGKYVAVGDPSNCVIILPRRGAFEGRQTSDSAN